ncbi:hypothetical protein SEVIR_5G226051v4 [Setaria viridis]
MIITKLGLCRQLILICIQWYDVCLHYITSKNDVH